MVRRFVSAVLFVGLLVTGLADDTDGMMIEQFVFQTTGNDCYAPDVPVSSGECYALVWTRTGASFSGFGMIPPEPNQWLSDNNVLVQRYFPIAARSEDSKPWSRCPEFTLPAGRLQPPELATQGTWTMYLLDTRYVLADGSKACGFDADVTNCPVRVNAYTPIVGLTDFSLDLTRSPVVKLVLTGGVESVATVADRKAEVIHRTISFDAQGGVSPEPQREVVYGDAYGELPVPTREGCAFLGWFTDAAGGEQVSAEVLATADATVYAHWGVTVRFDANGGTADEESRKVVADTEVGVLPGASRTGYHFDGWYTAAKDGTRVEATTPVTADVTYYAHWTANNYTVEFNERGGEGEMEDQEMTWDEEEALYRNAFTRKGYSFLGWTSDDQELEEVQYYDGVVVSNLTSEAGGEFDLYAVWAANAYTVTFHANGGEGEMEPQEFLYDEEQTLTANAFTSLDYAFAGWATSEDGDVVYKNVAKVKNLTDEADGNIDLYAVWSGLRSEVVDVGVKTTIKTADVFGEELKGYAVDGLPEGLKYDAKKGVISGTVTKTSEIGKHEVTLEKESDVRTMLIVVPDLPTIDAVLSSERESDTNGCVISGIGSYQVGKNVTLKVTVPKGSKERATAFLGWYMKVDGKEDAPWPDEKNYTKTSVSYKMTSESVSLVAKVAAETTDDVTVDCSGLRAYGGQITAGVAGSATGIPLDIETVGGVPPKSVKVANLPSGMKYDAKTGLITGAPTKAGESKKVTITVTTAKGVVKTSDPIALTVVALPDSVVGTFDGFVLNGVAEDCKDDETLDDCGTLSLTVKADGKLSAKAVTADGTYSFSGTCWDAADTNGIYYATLKSKTDTLTLKLDSEAAWNEQQLGGKLMTAKAVVRDVTAQKNAFGQPWYFSASGGEDGWDLAYTNIVKGAPLTVTLKLDGTTTIAGTLTGTNLVSGKLATYKVSAKGSANVSMMTNGAFVADFAPVVTVGKEKKVLSIRTNLWMDRDNSHVDDEFGVGDAKLVGQEK